MEQYKVIADFPGSPFQTGSIWNKESFLVDPELFPHIFMRVTDGVEQPKDATVAGMRWVKLEDFEFQTHETVYAKWEPYPNNTWRSCCNKDHKGNIRWHGDEPRGRVQVYIWDESTPSGSQDFEAALQDELIKMENKYGISAMTGFELGAKWAYGLRSATPNPEDAVKFAEWINKEPHLLGTACYGWFYDYPCDGGGVTHKIIGSTANLYCYWKSLQNKQP